MTQSYIHPSGGMRGAHVSVCHRLEPATTHPHRRMHLTRDGSVEGHTEPAIEEIMVDVRTSFVTFHRRSGRKRPRRGAKSDLLVCEVYWRGTRCDLLYLISIKPT